MNEWNLKIVEVGWKLDLDIYIFRKKFDGTIELFDGTIINDGVTAKPTISLNRELLQLFANELNSRGINPKKEFIEGKLEATEKHLLDMRKLLKLN
jgi:hypothetical protein